MQRSAARWNSFAAIIALAGLAACNSAEEAAPVAAETPAEVVEAEPSLAPPGAEDFKTAWADACPSAKPVSTALCKSKGLTDPNFECDFGLGEDEYRRNTAELTRGDDSWELADAEQACTIGSDAG